MHQNIFIVCSGKDAKDAENNATEWINDNLVSDNTIDYADFLADWCIDAKSKKATDLCASLIFKMKKSMDRELKNIMKKMRENAPLTELRFAMKMADSDRNVMLWDANHSHDAIMDEEALKAALSAGKNLWLCGFDTHI